MKLKELAEKYGEYEIYPDSPKHIEDALKNLDKGDGVLCLCVKKPKPKTVWELKEGDRYFVLYTDGDMADYEWKRDGGISKGYRDQGNIFPTKEEAKKEAERRAVETLLLKHGGRRWYKRHGENFGFLIDNVDRFSILSLNKIQGTIYFDTEEQVGKAIEQIGEERLKKALFEVKEE